MKALHESQQMALAHVRANAARQRYSAVEKAAFILKDAGLPMHRYRRALSVIQSEAPIDVSFHPDRPTANGETVAASLLASGAYKSQFETGISNGGLTAFKGGNRDLWEQRLFGGAYQAPGVVAALRPKYGALNLMNYWDGACPRFGSCYFRLKPAVASRCTFAYGDSSAHPDDIVALDQFEAVFSALIDDVFNKQAALGARELGLDALLERLSSSGFSSPLRDDFGSPGRCLDECIEVHIHGPLKMSEDVEWLAVDRSFHSTTCGRQLIELSQRFQFPIRWNPSLQLTTDQVPDDFRGAVMVPLARHIAPDGVLTAVDIGAAVVALNEHPEDWIDWGSFEETLQYLKQLWHVLVVHGQVTQDE